ncbi:MAG: DUF4271 domain-containing protein [Bacteroidales bacterium]|nr:DUF4271 domain-containing protein [Bacteroides sp.]MCM1198400.1 DUF4271 domain-containing protein [Clostridium sp.]MCM1502252.1 DUF4271 domain-containing protein [Bacteroidales bacterium]
MEEIMPVDSAFTGGTLELGHEAGTAVYSGSEYGDMLTDALIIMSVLAAVLSVRRIVDIIPSLISCMMRWKEAFNLEYSVKLSRNRDIVSAILLIPFCLLVSRYRIYSPRFLDGMEPSSRALSTIGIVICYIMVRNLLSYSLKGKAVAKAAWCAADKSFRTFFCSCTLILLSTAGVLSFAGIPDNTVKTVLIYVSGALYLLFIFRKCQIFNHSCNLFTTILYLCTLEILPTGLLVASALVL